MAGEQSKRDANYVPVISGVTDDANKDITQVRVDPTTKRLKVAQSALDKSTDKVTNEPEGHDAAGTGTLAVTTAGTKVQLPDVSCKRVFIQASEWNGDIANCPNGGIVVIGDTNVVAAQATRRGLALLPTQGEWFNVSNLNLLYIDSEDDGAKIHYYYEN